MAQMNIYDALLARENVFTQKQEFAEGIEVGEGAYPSSARSVLDVNTNQDVMTLPRLANPQTAVPLADQVEGMFSYDVVPGRLAYRDANGWHVVRNMDDLITLTNVSGLEGDFLPNHLYTPGRGSGQAFASGTEEGASFDMTTTTHPNKGAAMLFGLLFFDERTGTLGIGAEPSQGFDIYLPTRFASLAAGFLKTGVDGVVYSDPTGGTGGLTDHGHTATADGGALTRPKITQSLQMVGQGTKPAAPPAGEYLVYPRTDGKLYIQNSAGVETELGGVPPPAGSIGDNFNTVQNPISTSSGGQTWTRHAGNFSSNGSVCTWTSGTPANALQFATLSGQSANGTIEVTIPTLGSATAIVFRYNPADGTGYIITRLNGYRLWSISGHTYGTNLQTGGTPANGDTLRIVLGTSTVSLYVKPAGGSFPGSPNLTQGSLTINQSLIAHGIGSEMSHTTCSFDDYVFTP